MKGEIGVLSEELNGGKRRCTSKFRTDWLVSIGPMRKKIDLRLIITGTKLMRMDSATDGRSPLTTPMIGVGIFFNQVRNEKFSRYEILETMICQWTYSRGIE